MNATTLDLADSSDVSRIVVNPPADLRVEGANGQRSSGQRSTLTWTNLSVQVGGTTVLSPINLNALAGDWIVLLGPNGAGKSTALRAGAGLLRGQTDGFSIAGSVHVNETPIRLLSARQLGQHVAVVPQSPVIPPGVSVLDYVLLGRTPHLGWLGRSGKHDHTIVTELLDRLDLGSMANRAVTSLSGGERQRAVIGRALAQQAPILVLDEPTSALDVGHQQQVLELVDELRVQRNLIVISAMHDLTLAGQYAHHLVLLVGGHTISQGTPAEVLNAEILGAHYGARLRSVQLPNSGVAVFPVRQDNHEAV
jgi:iron complex transport system ATP-binding protein